MQKTILDNFISYLRYKPIFKNIPKELDSLLDIGSGKNPWFLKLKKLPSKIYAIDRFDNIENKSLPINYLKLEIKDKIPFNDNYFDLITMLAVLEHLEQEKEILTDIFRILKPGGYFLITVPTKYAKPVLEFLAFKIHLINEDSIREHKRYYTKNYLLNLIQNLGFKINRIYYFEFGFNLFVLAQKPH